MDDIVVYNSDKTMIISRVILPTQQGADSLPIESYFWIYFKRARTTDYLAQNIKIRIKTATGLLSGDTDENGQTLIDSGEVQFKSDGCEGDGIVDDEMDWTTLGTTEISIGDMPTNTARKIWLKVEDTGGVYGKIQFQVEITYETQRTQTFFTQFDIPVEFINYYGQKYFGEGVYN